MSAARRTGRPPARALDGRRDPGRGGRRAGERADHRRRPLRHGHAGRAEPRTPSSPTGPATRSTGGSACSSLPGPEASVVEAVVALPDGRGGASGPSATGVRPALLFDDSYRAILALRDNPDWQEAMRRRGHHRLREGPDRPLAHRQLREPRSRRAAGSPGASPTTGRSRPTTATPGPSRACWPPWTRPGAMVLEVLDLGVVPLPDGPRQLPPRGQPAAAHRPPALWTSSSRRGPASPSTATS